MLSQRTLNNFNDTEYALNVVGLIAQVRYVIKYQSSAPMRGMLGGTYFEKFSRKTFNMAKTKEIENTGQASLAT